jgi:hypothetical protein
MSKGLCDNMLITLNDKHFNNLVGLLDSGGEFFVDNVHKVKGTANLSLKLEELKRRRRRRNDT